MKESLKGVIDYSRREFAGRSVENNILDALKTEHGYSIEHASKDDNIKRGIDGWWIGKDGKRHGIQVKFRERGDDIIMEMVKDIDAGVEGRDAKSQADYYLLMGRNGLTRLFEYPPIKKKAYQLIDLAYNDWKTDVSKRYWESNGWQMRVQRGDRNNEKLMVYINPNSFKTIASWNLDIKRPDLREMILHAEIKKMLLS